jgi:hypothetical protein
MRAWQLLACLALCVAVSSAFSVPYEHYGGDLEVAASKHEESGYEESGGSDHGAEHGSKVSLVNL